MSEPRAVGLERVESLDATLQRHKAEKYDHKLERIVRLWVAELLDESFDDAQSFHELFKDGVLLCRYAATSLVRACSCHCTPIDRCNAQSLSTSCVRDRTRIINRL